MRVPKLLRKVLHQLGATRDSHEIRLALCERFGKLKAKST